ncbi:lysophospholipase [Actinobacteria bacterium YIM 96077]|uniref:Lysophospholipase n=1 Tax=Phytoactinopolyspora halophila TaxID=1981511 RepID=A0A329R5Q1_9ACTN|nr:GDSL-type esterase/lipase family protein [Phytoactinopolyspora halophila]AYY12004.1 lysophospholipase [Actinobacteria bacterium YIM 96077]RAW18762.1 lysophospholipase [Phytoactinopolyspora halophila]
MRDVRVCAFGDSFVAGIGDPKALGWVGRVAARTPPSTGVDLTMYPLGVRRQTTEEVVLRIPMECAPRFTHGDEHRIVVATGVSDARMEIEPERSAAALDFGLAATDAQALVVGPPPVGDEPLQQRIQVLDDAFATLCQERQVSYISTYRALARRKTWHEARADDGIHPNQSGYGILAYVLLNEGWYEWLGVEPPKTPVKRRHTTSSTPQQ